MYKRLTATLVTALLWVAVAGCGSNAESAGGDVVKIGGLFALTGPAAPFGTREAAAAKQVVKEINESGGIDQQKIEFVVKDTKSQAAESVRLANQLVQDEEVISILGATTGSETLSLANIAVRAKIPVIAPVATPEVTAGNAPYTEWIFRDAPNGRDSLPLIYDKIAKEGHRRLAVFYQEDAYGTDSFKTLQKLAKDGPMRIVGSASAPLDASDVTAQLMRLNNARPDSMLTISSAPALSGSVYRTAAELKIRVPVFGGDSVAQKATLTAANNKTANLIAPAVVNPDDDKSLPKLFDLMRQAGGVEGYGELLGANGMAVIVAGLRTGARTGEELKKAIETVGPVEGYGRSPMKYSASDHDGWGTDMFFWVTAEKGKFINVN